MYRGPGLPEEQSKTESLGYKTTARTYDQEKEDCSEENPCSY